MRWGKVVRDRFMSRTQSTSDLPNSNSNNALKTNLHYCNLQKSVEERLLQGDQNNKYSKVFKLVNEKSKYPIDHHLFCLKTFHE